MSRDILLALGFLIFTSVVNAKIDPKLVQNSWEAGVDAHSALVRYKNFLRVFVKMIIKSLKWCWLSAEQGPAKMQRNRELMYLNSENFSKDKLMIYPWLGAFGANGYDVSELKTLDPKLGKYEK